MILLKSSILKTVFIILFCIGFYNLSADDRSDLEKLKSEINDLKNKYDKEIKKEKDELNKLNLIESSISDAYELQLKILNSKLDLENKIELNKSDIHNLGTNIEKNNSQLEENKAIIKQLQSNLAQRYRTLYLKKNRKSYLFSLSPASFGYSLNAFKYFRIIKKFDQSNIESYKTLKSRLETLTTQLETNKNSMVKSVSSLETKVSEKIKLIELEKKQLEELTEKQKDKKKSLKKINSNKNLYQAMIKEKEKAAKEMMELITRLENDRKIREEKRIKKEAAENNKPLQSKQAKTKKTVTPEKPAPNPPVAAAVPKQNFKFSSFNSGLEWPVVGKIITSFGEYINKETKTVTFNTGIEIETEKEARVKAVSNGEIVKTIWIRGYGSTLILEHGSGYYSVYSNLFKILKNEGEAADAGENIAVVGEENNKGKLHFEIWHKKEKLNPKNWLK